MLLVNKYSPTCFGEIIGNKDIVGILSNIGDDFPHLLLTGPPGTGKTTLAHILKGQFDALELNASDERGVDTVRTRIKNFCHKSSANKLVILDECDSLTAAAQQALRRLMESTDTRFILICNDMSKVIEPIQSRCAVLRFNKISAEEFAAKVSDICQREKISLTPAAYEALTRLSGGDMRACLNCLQALVGMGRAVDDEFLYKINGMPNYAVLESILASLKRRDAEACAEAFERLWEQKYESADLMSGFFSAAKNHDSYEALRIIGKYHSRILDGVSSKLQFYAMFSELLAAGI